MDRVLTWRRYVERLFPTSCGWTSHHLREREKEEEKEVGFGRGSIEVQIPVKKYIEQSEKCASGSCSCTLQHEEEVQDQPKQAQASGHGDQTTKELRFQNWIQDISAKAKTLASSFKEFYSCLEDGFGEFAQEKVVSVVMDATHNMFNTYTSKVSLKSTQPKGDSCLNSQDDTFWGSNDVLEAIRSMEAMHWRETTRGIPFGMFDLSINLDTTGDVLEPVSHLWWTIVH